MSLYIVDSNFFIQAHRLTYPLDVARGFWLKGKQLSESNAIVSIDKVKKELYRNNDELKKWCEINLPERFFKETTHSIDEYRRVSAWAVSMNHHYTPNALAEFLNADEADAFLIAYALEDPIDRVIVTYEVSELNRKNKIKIPDCCNTLGARYINMIEMFRELGETF